MSPQKGLLLIDPTPRYEVKESSAAGAARRSSSTMARRVDYSFVGTMETSVRAVEHREMIAIEVVNLRHQDANDRATEYIMRTQALGARARVDTLEDDGSSS
nr:hypothetical protein [Tanacetum cinerariifolium]